MDNSLKVLSERLDHVQREVVSIRQELMELDRSLASQQASTQRSLAQFRVNKGLHHSLMKNLFAELCIEGEPLEPEELQERMEKAGLAANELSRDLIKAREE